MSCRTDGGAGQRAGVRIAHSHEPESTWNWTRRFITIIFFYLFDTIWAVEVVDNFCGHLVALVTDQSQGIDSIHEVVLHLSLRETAALSLSLSGLEM